MRRPRSTQPRGAPARRAWPSLLAVAAACAPAHGLVLDVRPAARAGADATEGAEARRPTLLAALRRRSSGDAAGSEASVVPVWRPEPPPDSAAYVNGVGGAWDRRPTPFPLPPGRADVSSTDLRENFNAVVGAAADSIHVFRPTGSNRAADILEDTCVRACMRCVIEVPVQPAAPCKCFANCRQGPDKQECAAASYPGWTSRSVTRPQQAWRAACGRGDRDCRTECLPKDFRERLDNCTGKIDEADCIYEMRQLYAPILANRHSRVYCTHKKLDSCDVFFVTPTNTSKRWDCYATRRECDFSKIPSNHENVSPFKISVWKGVKAQMESEAESGEEW